MMSPPTGTTIWVAAGVTDMRRGFTGLSAAVQTVLKENPFGGQVFVFRGKRGDLVKVLWWDGDGYVYSRSGWSAAASSGQKPNRERWR